MTRKLYETDPTLTCCTATVLDCLPAGDGWDVITDATVIFPGGGGQPCDRGTVNGAEILSAREQDGAVLHRCSRAFGPGESVELVLDTRLRLDHSQQHTGEHMLSHALWKLYGAKNIGFHMSEAMVTIDFDLELTAGQCARAEDMVNAQIYADRPVTVLERRDDDLADLDVRKATDKVKGLLRVVVVEGGDVCTCCGTHVQSTGQVGLVKLFGVQRHRGGTRIEFLCGRLAFEELRRRTETLHALTTELSCDYGRAPDSLRDLKLELKQTGLKLRSTSARLMDYCAAEALAEAPEKAGVRCAFAALELGAAEAKQLLTRLLADGPALAAVIWPNGDRLNYLTGRSDGVTLSCREVAGLLNGLLNGKGGGSDTLAQGAGKYTPDWRELVTMARDAALRML